MLISFFVHSSCIETIISIGTWFIFICKVLQCENSWKNENEIYIKNKTKHYNIPICVMQLLFAIYVI